MSEEWYEIGLDWLNQERSSRSSVSLRFWLPPDSEREIVFVDSDGFSFAEHNFRAGGSWRNWATCIRNIDPEGCPLCGEAEAGNDKIKRYMIAMYTIIDCSEWKDRQGKIHKNELRVLPAKRRVANKIKRQAEKRGDLSGCKFTIYRGQDRTSDLIESFEFIEKVDLADYNNPKPFDYWTLFKPKSARALRKLISEEEDEEDAEEIDLDDAPF